METPYQPHIEDREDVSNYETYPEDDDKSPMLYPPDHEAWDWCKDF